MKTKPPCDDWVINFVVTVPEACEMWDKPRNTLLYAIDAGNIVARKSGSTWLISVPSLVKRWGWPRKLA